MADIFREVDEEVRQDRALEFWKKYQNIIVALAAIVVIAAGGWRFWQAQQMKAAYAADEKLQAAFALSREGKPQEAEAAFAALAKDAPKGYAAIAQMRAAAELAARDRKAAVAAFDKLAGDAAFDPLFRDVARLRAGMIRVDDADMKEIEERLSPLAAAGQPFRSSARELLGLAALKFNDLDQAGRMFDQIVTDTEAPAAMKQRAEAFLGLVRSDSKPR
ncbi:MAG: tetratricopeptide repeat protein [Rhodoblastus sp.]